MGGTVSTGAVVGGAVSTGAVVGGTVVGSVGAVVGAPVVGGRVVPSVGPWVVGIVVLSVGSVGFGSVFCGEVRKKMAIATASIPATAVIQIPGLRKDSTFLIRCFRLSLPKHRVSAARPESCLPLFSSAME